MRVLLVPYVHGLGHLVRMVALANQLRARGHEVELACGELGEAIATFHRLTRHPIHEVQPFRSATERMNDGALRTGMIKNLADPEYLSCCLRDELRVAEACQPDLIVSDFRHTAGVTAARLGIPCVSLYNVGIISSIMPGILPAITSALAKIPAVEALSGRIWGDALAIAGWSFFEPLDLIPMAMLSGILASVREIRYVGPILRDNPRRLPTREVLRAGALDRPFYYVSVGGTGLGTPYLRETLAALSPLDADVTVTTGPNIAPELLSASVAGSRARFTFHSFVQEPLMSLVAADVAVLHGGHISTMEAMLAGTPVVIRPQQVEQRLNGERVQALGLGQVLPQDLTDPRSIRDAVERTHRDESLRSRCTEFRERFDAARCLSDLAAFLEDFVRWKPSLA